MAITVPYSLELTANESAHEVTAGAVVTAVADKMKVYLGSAVDPAKRTSIDGSLTACFNKLMFEAGRGVDSTGNTKVARGTFNDAAQGNITIESVTTNIGTTDVAIIVAGDFGSERNQTLAYRETFRKLVAKLTENTGSN